MQLLARVKGGVNWPERYDPDMLAVLATQAGLQRHPSEASLWTLRSIASRAHWLMINGKWHKRKEYLA